MAKNYSKIKYFETRPDIVKIFQDLEELHDFCRFELLPFNPADLYNRHSKIWRWFESTKKPFKPYQGKPKFQKRKNFR